MRARASPWVLSPVERGRYLDALIRRYNTLDLAALTPEAFDDNLPMLLRNIFVGQHARPDPPPVELPRELWRRLIDSGDLDGNELTASRSRTMERREGGSDGQDWIERARRARQRHLEATPRSILDVLCDPLVRTSLVLGDPGSGKSSLLRYLAVSIGGKKSDLPESLIRWRDWLPILIELREYAGTAWRTGVWVGGGLLDYLDYLHVHGGLGIKRDVADALLRQDSRIVVMFDGLDELFNPTERATVARDIARFALTYRNVKIVVTSRPIGDQRNILDTAGFNVYGLNDLDRQQIGKFVESWFHTACRNDASEADELTTRLLGAIDQSPSVRELAGNPLLLTILSIIGQRRALPRERHRVFAHATDVLVQHWDVARAIREPGIDIDFIDEQDKREMLRRIAHRIQNGTGGIAANHIHGDDLQDEFQRYIDEQYPRLPDGRAKVIAKSMLRQFRERNFILSRFGPGMYGFVHRAFLEYFCAAEIVYRFEKTQQLTVEELASDIFGDRAGDPAWHEVLMLIAGMVDEGRVAIVVDHLFHLDNTPAGRIRAIGGYWLLGVECLAEARSMRRLAEQHVRSIEMLGSLLVEIRMRLCFQPDPLVAAESTIFRGDVTSLDRIRQGTTILRGLVKPAFDFELDAAWYARGPLFLEGVAHDSLDREWHGAAAAALLAWGVNERTRSLLVSRFTAEDWRIRMAVVPAIATGWPDEPTRALLATGIEDENWRVRLAVVKCMAKAWPDGQTCATFINRLLVESDGDVLDELTQSLVRTWPGDETRQKVIVLSGAKSWRARLASVTALSAAPFNSDDVRRILMERGADGNWRVRLAAITGLISRFPGDTTRDLVMSHTNDAAPQVRLAAAQWLAKGWPDEGTRVVLEKSMNEDDPPITLAVAQTQAMAGGWPTEQPWAVLTGRISDADWRIRLRALKALADAWRTSETRALIIQRIELKDWELLTTAIEALVAGWPDEDTRKFLVKHVADDDWRMQVAALRALAEEWPHEKTRLLLERKSCEGYWRVRGDALAALAAGWPDEGTRAFLSKRLLAETNSDVRQVVAKELGERWSDGEACSLLVEVATASDDADFIRTVVSTLDPEFSDGSTRQFLIGRAGDENWTIRLAAMESLVAVWPDPETRSLLEGMILDANWRVRLAAARLLLSGWPDERTRGALEFLEADSCWQVRLVVCNLLAVGRDNIAE